MSAVIDPKKLTDGVDPALAVLLEPIILAHSTGVIDGYGAGIARQLQAVPGDQARYLLGLALIYGAGQAVFAEQVQQMVAEMTP